MRTTETSLRSDGGVQFSKGLILECSFSQKKSFPRKRRLTRALFRIWHPKRTRDTGTKGCGGLGEMGLSYGAASATSIEGQPQNGGALYY
jgi:hypothetical protein